MLTAAIKDLFRPLRRFYRNFTGIDLIEAKLDNIRRHNELIGVHLHLLNEKISLNPLNILDLDEPSAADQHQVMPVGEVSADSARLLANLESNSQAPWDILYAISEKLDVLLHHRHSTDRTDVLISREADRLDGYLKYHADLIREDLRNLIKEKNCDNQR
ncbi:MAG: hypothetical protein H7312_14280 [Tardiphaga sp.]|nr:hypothetical protein [Tardiphaga sp.]